MIRRDFQGIRNRQNALHFSIGSDNANLGYGY
jgi:hypothetical protein